MEKENIFERAKKIKWCRCKHAEGTHLDGTGKCLCYGCDCKEFRIIIME